MAKNEKENTDIPEGKPVLDVKYLAFVPTAGVDLVVASFRDRFQEDPKEVFRHGKLIWAGPIPNQAEGDRMTKLELMTGYESPMTGYESPMATASTSAEKEIAVVDFSEVLVDVGDMKAAMETVGVEDIKVAMEKVERAWKALSIYREVE